MNSCCAPASLIILFISLVLAGCQSAQRQAEGDLGEATFAAQAISYSLDTERTQLRFSVPQGKGALTGDFGAVDGRLSFSRCDIESGQLEVVIATKSVAVDTPLVASMLRGGGWFDSDNFPLAEFRSTAFADISAQGLLANGLLKIKTQAGPISLQVRFPGISPGQFPAEIPFDASGQFSRSEYGMSDLANLAGDKISLTVTGVLVAEDSGGETRCR